MANSSETSGEKLNYQERRKRVIVLRKGGASLRAIAEYLGVSHETVRNDIDAMLQQLIREQQHEVAAWRALELERLDTMQLGIWLPAAKGDLSAIDRVLKIMERRAKYLGLDMQKAATNIQIPWDALTDDQLERIAAGEDPLMVVRS